MHMPFFLGHTLHQKSESWALFQDLSICFEFLFIVSRHLTLSKESHGDIVILSTQGELLTKTKSLYSSL